MSDKLNKKIQDKNKQIELTSSQFQYMNSLDVIDRSFKFYFEQLKTEYLQTIAQSNGYKATDQLELTIDLQSESHLLNIRKLG